MRRDDGVGTIPERVARGKRFGRHDIERRAREAGRSLKEMTLAEMDLLWEESKGLEAES